MAEKDKPDTSEDRFPCDKCGTSDERKLKYGEYRWNGGFREVICMNCVEYERLKNG